MTQKTIDLLKARTEGAKPAKGFFLQVESASIDKRDHAADPCGQIGETVVFDEAVKKALDFAKQDGNTLVIATADHGHTSQIVEPVHRRGPAGHRRRQEAADRARPRHRLPRADART